MSTNNNADLIPALREAADYLEAHPDIPEFSIAWLHAAVSTKEQLRAAARAMGSFDKQATDSYYKLIHAIGGLFKVEVSIPREYVCKKVVTWECPEDLETLLAEPATEAERCAEVAEGQ